MEQENRRPPPPISTDHLDPHLVALEKSIRGFAIKRLFKVDYAITLKSVRL